MKPSINEQLFDLYTDYFVNMEDKPSSEQLEFSMPFLLKVSDDYELSKKKILIVGQETFEWHGKYKNFLLKENPVEYAQNAYSNFLSENAAKYNSAFWNYINLLFKEAEATWLWNNVFKFETVEYLSCPSKLGKRISLGTLNKNKKYKYLIDEIKRLQRDVFLQELEILKPDVLIFLTGNPYDKLFLDWQFDTQNNFFLDNERTLKAGVDKWKFGKLSHRILKPVQTYSTIRKAERFLNLHRSRAMTQ